MRRKQAVKTRKGKAILGRAARNSEEDPNRYPKSWDAKRVQAVIDHYDNQTDEEAIAEADAAYRTGAVTMMAIPVELVPKVIRLIGKPTRYATPRKGRRESRQRD